MAFDPVGNCLDALVYLVLSARMVESFSRFVCSMVRLHFVLRTLGSRAPPGCVCHHAGGQGAADLERRQGIPPKIADVSDSLARVCRLSDWFASLVPAMCPYAQMPWAAAGASARGSETRSHVAARRAHLPLRWCIAFIVRLDDFRGASCR